MMREYENRLQPHSGKDTLVYLIAALLGLLLVLTALAALTTRFACGAWAIPDGIAAPLRFFTTGDGGSFGRTPQGCAAPGAAIITVWIVFTALMTVAGVFGWRAWQNRATSDKEVIKRLRRREGLAKRSEIAKAVGPKAAASMTSKVRPTLAEADQTAAAGNIRVGRAEGVECWIGMEDSVTLIGPPRSGKGLNVVVGAIIDAPGPVITTSSRSDNYALTAPLRSKKGPVTLFDPQGLTGKATTVKWSPISGCEKAQTANQRATSLIGAAGLSAEGNNAEWRAPAIQIMQSLLHAAALGGRNVDALMRWGLNPAEAREAVHILREHEADGTAALGWASSLLGEIDGDPKMRANKWFGVSNAVQGLSVDSVRDALNPRTRDEEFNIDQFINECGTLYIMGTKSGGGSAGPYLIAMMDAITERARELAARKPGNRLDPPLALILDEIANIATAWEGLVQLMADGGGVGISAWPIFQSLAQPRNEWGDHAASAIFDASTVTMLLGGSKNVKDLQDFQALAGQRMVMRSSRSRQTDGSTVSEQLHDRQVLEVSDLRNLPFGWSLMFYRSRRPMLMELTAYGKRADSTEIKNGKKIFDDSLLDPAKDVEWESLLGQRAPLGDLLALEATPARKPAADVPAQGRDDDDDDVDVF